MDVATSLRQLTEISDYISQEISTGEDPSLQNRTPMPFIFKNEWCLTRVEKSGEHGEHAPGTPKVFPRNTQCKNYLKDVGIVFEAICCVKIAPFINISILVPIA